MDGKKPVMLSEKNKPDIGIMILAGEESGDLVGAALYNQLKKLNPQLAAFGIGGDRMKSAGVNILFHVNKMAFLGFTEVIRHIPFIKKVQRALITQARENSIRIAVLIDYPGFNLSIAKKFKEYGIKIIYYISPQIWAWGSGRMKKISRLVDKMMVVFPFEEKLYRQNNVNVEFIGHPLVERINEYNFLSRDELYQKFELDKTKGILLLMPGSRRNEVAQIYPRVIKAAQELAEKFNLQIVVACSSNIDENVFYDMRGSQGIKLVKGNTYDLLRHSKFGIIKSGTSTLEAGYFSLPMIIVYRTSWLTYLIGKMLIKLDRIGMINILLDEKIVPELVQNEITTKNIIETADKILCDESNYLKVKTKLEDVKTQLGSTGASERAAKIIYGYLNEP